MRKNICVLSIFLFLLQSLTFSQGFYKLDWYDEFNGTQLDKSKWSCQTGTGELVGGMPGGWGWGNDEQQYYTDRPDNVFVSNGMLTIRGKRETPKYCGLTVFQPVAGECLNYTSTRIRTFGKYSTKYGRIEARISLPIGQGLWPAFWMMPEHDVYGTWAASGEIDIMEARGRFPDCYAGGAIHFGGKWPDNTYFSSGDIYYPNGKTQEDFHVYAIEWKEGEIKWFLD